MICEKYELVVIGGGLSGMCAALAAARLGVKTALCQDRSVLGGNASSEIKMHVCGADKGGAVKDARETGIIEELLLKNRYYNPQRSFSVQDAVFYSIIKNQQNLDLFLNTRADSVETENNRIKSIIARQSNCEKEYKLSADFFIDASGDGTIAALAGAKFFYGRESRDTFNEPHAPEIADNEAMGSSIMFTAKDEGHPIKYIKPSWAYTFTEQDLTYRDHSEVDNGYWWMEVSGEYNTVFDNEKIYDELLKVLYGVWDHIKNQEGHNAENYALDWVGTVVGKREGRRFIGDYVLNENDIAENKQFDDAVAYGGWCMDVHIPRGVFSFNESPTTFIPVDDFYQIPFRSLYSVNIDNLLLSGRDISTSHIAFGSTRVMGTCAVIGQAVGTAVAVAKKYGITTVREINTKIHELQQLLLQYDCYIPNIKNNDEKDLARKAKVTATSEKEGCYAENVINGISRNIKQTINCYESDGNKDVDVLSLKWDSPITADNIIIKFDSDLSNGLTISISEVVHNRQQSFPKNLIKHYKVELFLNEKIVETIENKENILRFNDIKIAPKKFDEMRLTLADTYGSKTKRVFEIRVYSDLH